MVEWKVCGRCGHPDQYGYYLSGGLLKAYTAPYRPSQATVACVCVCVFVFKESVHSKCWKHETRFWLLFDLDFVLIIYRQLTTVYEVLNMELIVNISKSIKSGKICEVVLCKQNFKCIINSVLLNFPLMKESSPTKIVLLFWTLITIWNVSWAPNEHDFWRSMWHRREDTVMIQLWHHRKKNYKRNTFVFAPIFHELNSKI